MKVFSILVLIFASCLLKANDTLTIAQVYSFNIGDTFDYTIEHNYQMNAAFNGVTQGGDYISFERDIITAVWTDTLTHIARHVYLTDSTILRHDYMDTLTLTNPQEYAIYKDSSCFQSTYYTIQPNSQYNNRTLNSSRPACFYDYYPEIGYAAGLGTVVNSSSYNIDMGSYDSGSGNDDFYLIYFAKGPERWGTPYYIADGETLIHFTPLPETCAVWYDTVAGWLDYKDLTATEEIKTGNQIPFHGHTYVEMLYTAYYYQDNHFIKDSLIGYFRNDTIAGQTVFYYTLTDSSFFTYDFKQLINGICINVDTVQINGIARTRWTYNPIKYPFGQGYLRPIQYVEGIGGLNGLIPVYHPGGYIGGSPTTPYISTFGSLTCFSICNQTIYPSENTASCAVISGLAEISGGSNSVKLYPTVNNGQFQVELSNPGNFKLSVCNVLGRQIHSSEIHAEKNLVTLNNPQAGIYFWKATIGEKVIETGRFIVVN